MGFYAAESSAGASNANIGLPTAPSTPYAGDHVRGFFAPSPDFNRSRNAQIVDVHQEFRIAIAFLALGLPRWLSRDPIVDEIFRQHARMDRHISRYTYDTENSPNFRNLYLFLNNNSCNTIDLFGLQANVVYRAETVCGKCGKEVPRRVFWSAQLRVNERWKKLDQAGVDAACAPWKLPLYDVRMDLKLYEQATVTGWDFTQLFEWNKYCKSANCGLTPTCEKSIWVEGSCYNAYEVNYVLFGWLNRMCGISREQMLTRIRQYRSGKELLPLYWGENMIQGAQAWANTGYDFWPGLGGTVPAPNANFKSCNKCGESLSLLSPTWPSGPSDR